MPVVSVITPTKNRLELLKETIASVQAQTFADWEHIIIDDGSDDGTEEELRRWAANDQRIRYAQREGSKAGASVCRNQGIESSTADLIIFLDSDDLLAPTCIERRSEVLSRNQDLDFVAFTTGAFLNKPGDLEGKADADVLGDDLLSFLFFNPPWQTTAPIWRKQSLQSLGGFDEDLPSWQDIELHVRAIASGMKYLRFPIIDHYMRWQEDETRVSLQQRRSKAHLKSAIRLFPKFEDMVREGPGMTWIRQRALCSLYFYIAELLVDSNELAEALKAWKVTKKRHLAKPHIYLPGMLLLLAQSLGPVGNRLGKRLAHKWKGLARFRLNAELLTR